MMIGTPDRVRIWRQTVKPSLSGSPTSSSTNVTGSRASVSSPAWARRSQATW